MFDHSRLGRQLPLPVLFQLLYRSYPYCGILAGMSVLHVEEFFDDDHRRGSMFGQYFVTWIRDRLRGIDEALDEVKHFLYIQIGDDNNVYRQPSIEF